MKRYLIIGASGGIGAALAATAQGEVVQLSRRAHGFDVRDPSAIAHGLASLDGQFDAVMIATGILAPSGAGPEKSLSAIDALNMVDVFQVNAIGPALILAGLLPLLPTDRPSSVGVLSARVGSIGDNRLGGWHSYRASKAALNQIIRGAAIEYGRKRPLCTLLALHPGTVETPFTANYQAPNKFAPEVAAKRLWLALEQSTPEQSGLFFDYTKQAIPW